MKELVLVTGAAGFIGSHLTQRLLADGFDVIGLDNLMTGSLANLEPVRSDPRFHFVVGDVRDKLPGRPTLIFNLACPAAPDHYQADPYATLMTSVMGAASLIECARSRACRVVHASTSEVYGDPEVHPQREDYWGHVNPIGPRACYDESKRAAETLLMDARKQGRLDARIVRIFNTYGPRMAFNDGRVVSNFVLQALRESTITIYGDGTQTRSFCFVDDLVTGLLAVGLDQNVSHYWSPMNLGNPAEITIRELASKVFEAVGGQEGRITHMPLPKDDPKRRCPDIARARALIGFEPKIDLKTGLERTVADFRFRLRRR